MSLLFDIYARRWRRHAEARAATDARWAEIEALRHDGDGRSTIMLADDLGLTIEVWKEQDEIFDRLNPRGPIWRAHWWLSANGPRAQMRRARIFVERGRRGYAIPDTWNLNSWHAQVIAGSVDSVAANAHGFPEGISFEEWKSILGRIAAGFRAAETIVDPRSDAVTVASAQAVFDEGFELYRKWFFNLWT